MEGFWKFLEAEALDGAKAPEGSLVTQALVIVEIERVDQSGYVVHSISKHHTGRSLRPHEAAGLLAKTYAGALDA